MLEEYKDVITVNELCAILRIGKNSAYRLLQSGEIRSRRLRYKYIIPKAGIIDYLQSA